MRMFQQTSFWMTHEGQPQTVPFRGSRMRCINTAAILFAAITGSSQTKLRSRVNKDGSHSHSFNQNLRRELERQKSYNHQLSNKTLLRWWRCVVAIWISKVMPTYSGLQFTFVFAHSSFCIDRERQLKKRSENLAKREEAMFDRENQCLVYVRKRQNFKQNLWWRSPHKSVWSSFLCTIWRVIWMGVVCLRSFITTFRLYIIRAFHQKQTLLHVFLKCPRGICIWHESPSWCIRKASTCECWVETSFADDTPTHQILSTGKNYSRL